MHAQCSLAASVIYTQKAGVLHRFLMMKCVRNYITEKVFLRKAVIKFSEYKGIRWKINTCLLAN